MSNLTDRGAGVNNGRRKTKAEIEAANEKPTALPVIQAGIPDRLKAERRWVCWRFERRSDKGGKARWTKVPINPRTGRPASSTDPQTWGPFQEAYDYYLARKLGGIGFMLGDGFAGVDWDDAVNPETGNLADWAAEDVAVLSTYTEVSPTGTGVKAILTGTKPGDRCTAVLNGKKIEVYDHARFFALTGAKLADSPASPEPRQQELANLYDRIFSRNGDTTHSPPVNGRQAEPSDSNPPQAAPKAQPTAAPDDLSDLAAFDDMYSPRIQNPTDDQMIELARTGTDKLSRLWAGDFSEYINDQNRADLALCLILLRLTNDDPDRADRLFRLSGLMRDKWDEKRGNKTYGQLTINRALEIRAGAANQAAGNGHASGGSSATANGQATNGDERAEAKKAEPTSNQKVKQKANDRCEPTADRSAREGG
jgi:primase-polymerase (primpol)-like protein